jgi:hypothetical protein
VQLELDFAEREKEQKEQWEQDRKHMDRRLRSIDREIETEPASIVESYRVVLRRLEPVGLVYLWPTSR